MFIIHSVGIKMENTQDRKILETNSIKYDNTVMDNKDTEIILKTFREKEKDSANVAVFTLKYNLEQDGKKTPYEVILGKIELKKSTENLSLKAKVVRDYLLAQLKENGKKTNDCEYGKKLLEICKKSKIPFIYTEEGIELVTNDSKSTRTIEKTYKTQEKDSTIDLICLNPYKRMDLYESELKIRKRISEKTKEHKLLDTAMKELKTTEEKNKLIRGKKINELRNETSEEVVLEDQRNNVIDYLIFKYVSCKGEIENGQEPRASMEDYLKMTQYLKSKNSDKKIPHSLVIGEEKEKTEAEKYFRLKEKGIAIDIRKMLEDSQNEALEKEIENGENDKNSEQFNERDNYINNCKTIFDFIKQGRDVNTQFFYSKRIDGFGMLYSIVEEQKDKEDQNGNKVYNSEEIIEYLKMKENIIKNIKLDKKSSFLDYDLYKENNSIRKFMKFVMNSGVRKDTKEQEKKMLLEMYHTMVDEIIKNAKDDVVLYNSYAERFNMNVCPIHEEKNKEDEYPGR